MLKLSSIICITAVWAFGQTTPNSHFLNDFSLEMESDWKLFNDQKFDLWNEDSILSEGSWILEELDVSNIKVGDLTYSGSFNYKNGGFVANSRSIVSKYNDNSGYISTTDARDTLTGQWYKSNQVEMKFNSSGQCISWTLSNYNQNNPATPQVTSMNVYHNASGLIDSSIMSMNMLMGGTTVSMRNKSVYQYDAQKRYSTRLDTTFMSMPNLPAPMTDDIKKTDLTYNTSSMTIKVYLFDNDIWQNEDSIYVSLNTDNQIDYEERYYWDDDNSEWTGGDKISYHYENGKIVSETEYSKADNSWSRTGIKRYYYTDYNNGQLPSLSGSVHVNSYSRAIDNNKFNPTRAVLLTRNNPSMRTVASEIFLPDGRKFNKLNTGINRIQYVIVR
ncbi:MAG TPA: hypothetical protein VHP36_08915 [Chitinispirillaceae bacterium]|nr:hypothetical protein [Chitinispirillaceae bacterium]